MSFVQRAITIVITAGPASVDNPNPITFGPNKQNTLTLAGHRVSANIAWAGGPSQVAAQISIYGMSESDMNTVASLGQLLYGNNLNQVSILAGDAEAGMSLVFQGTLQTAFVNTSASPRVSFDMTATTGHGLAMNPIPPASFGGAASVATIMANFAEVGGLAFENNGVATILSNPYFPGTLFTQIKSCARAANINFAIDPVKGGFNGGTLAIWPKYGFRGGAATPINPQTGMIGYPRYTAPGIDVDMLFNPTLLFAGQLNVTSSLQPACGIWNIYSMSHNIESITPGGDWMTTVQCFSPQNFARLGAG
jgi:hypothetical protein